MESRTENFLHDMESIGRLDANHDIPGNFWEWDIGVDLSGPRIRVTCKDLILRNAEFFVYGPKRNSETISQIDLWVSGCHDIHIIGWNGVQMTRVYPRKAICLKCGRVLWCLSSEWNIIL